MKISKINHFFQGILLLSILVFSGAAVHSGQQVRLLGAGNYFQMTPLTKTPKITYEGADGKYGTIAVASFIGGLQPIDTLLPVKVTVQRPGETPWEITIKEEKEAKDQLACQGNSSKTIVAVIGTGNTSAKRICLPISDSNLPTSATGIRSGEFNNIAMLFGPYDKDKIPATGEMPVKFGIMPWTSIVNEWKFTTLDRTPSSESKTSVVFSSPLHIRQGFAGIGGGAIPRGFHGTIAHIYNDSDNFLIISRNSDSLILAKYDITQIIKPHSAYPYAMLWIPKVSTADDLSTPGHNGISISAITKKITSQRSGDEERYSDIGDTGSGAAFSRANMPKDFADLDALINESDNAPKEARELTGEATIDDQIKSQYSEFRALSSYYAISTVEQNQMTSVQQCDANTNGCTEIQSISTPPAYNKMNGTPTYYRLIIKNGKNKDKDFDVNLESIALVSSKKYE